MNDDQNPLRPIGGGKIIHTRSERPTHVVYCSDCYDSGTVLACPTNAQVAPYAFRCLCERGERSTRPYPPWRFVDRSLYEIVRAAT